MNIGDLLLKQGVKLSIDNDVRHFHTKVFMPDWYEKYFNSFDHQITKMSSPTKPFKATDYFKIKAGYPHEVMAENKDKLIKSGCKRDRLSNKNKINIPKLTLHHYNEIKHNVIVFTAPKDKKFIRDITIYDDITHKSLVFIYVVNRKAQVITAWAEPKSNGQHIIKIPKNLIKSLKYELE